MTVQAIRSQCAQLGQTIETLGSSSRYYLRYNETQGWSIKQLNCIQWLFRKIFGALGAFSSTHLSTIAKKISDFPDLHRALGSKIEACWTKTYPKQDCPFKVRIDTQAGPRSPRRQPASNDEQDGLLLPGGVDGIELLAQESGMYSDLAAPLFVRTAAATEIAAKGRVVDLDRGMRDVVAEERECGLGSYQLRHLSRDPVYDGPALERDEYLELYDRTGRNSWFNLSVEERAVEICNILKSDMLKTNRQTVTTARLGSEDIFKRVVNNLLDEGYVVQEEREFGFDNRRIGSRLRVTQPRVAEDEPLEGEMPDLNDEQVELSVPGAVEGRELFAEEPGMYPDPAVPLFVRTFYGQYTMGRVVDGDLKVEDQTDEHESSVGHYQLRRLSRDPVYDGPIQEMDEYLEPYDHSGRGSWFSLSTEGKAIEICDILKADMVRTDRETYTTALLPSEDVFKQVVNNLLDEGYTVQEEREFDLNDRRIGSRLRVTQPRVAEDELLERKMSD